MSLWQYALLLLMLVTFAFYSLPTFFGEQPSLGLHGQSRLSDAQHPAGREPHRPPQADRPGWPDSAGVRQPGEQQLAKQLLEQQGWTAPP
jgi:preprotein translocase subunit SecD